MTLSKEKNKSKKKKKKKKKRGIKSQFEKLFNPEGQQNYISI
jgi:hypothetical protein